MVELKRWRYFDVNTWAFEGIDLNTFKFNVTWARIEFLTFWTRRLSHGIV